MGHSPIISGDDNYLGICALVTVGQQLFFFFIAYAFQFDKVTDFSGALNFLLNAWIVFFHNGEYTDRQVIAFALVHAWAIRLGGFLLYRVLQRKKDERFDEMRSNFFSFLGFWIFQMVWVWIVSLPLIYLFSAHVDVELGARDYIGWILWGIGFIFQSLADHSKHVFTMDPANRNNFISEGVWSVSRHPNYFGEISMWLGIFLTSSSVFDSNTKSAYGSVASPIFTFLLLMFVSGIPMAAARSDKKHYANPAYLEYKKSTSPLIPMPTCLYRNLPNFFKCGCCCEFPMYNSTLNEMEAQSGKSTNP